MRVQADPAAAIFTEPPEGGLVFTWVFIRDVRHIFNNRRQFVTYHQIVGFGIQTKPTPQALDRTHKVLNFVKRLVRLQVGDKME